jgi:hypothetical protein
MYSAFLLIHSWLRWVVILVGLFAAVRAMIGVAGRKPWSSADASSGRWFSIALDFQFLIGLILYIVLSPFIRDGWADMAATMRNAPLRFFVVEHVFGMIVALALVHVGRVKIRRATDGARKHKLAAIFFGIAIVVILLSIPWPGTPGGRPLFRGFGESSASE